LGIGAIEAVVLFVEVMFLYREFAVPHLRFGQV
jgi:hypothetical protein